MTEEQDFYPVQGGPGDGKKLPKKAFPDLQNFGVISLRTPSNPHQVVRYRREGEELIHLDTTDVFVFYGGPLDGEMWEGEKAPVPDGDNAVIPVGKLEEGNRKYAWYHREGQKLNYIHTADKADVIAMDTGMPEIPKVILSKEALSQIQRNV